MCDTTSALVRREPVSALSAAERDFSERLIGIANQASLALMISIGHRTGLFEAMKAAGPASSTALAMQAALSERYVREWLGAMAVGKLVELIPAASGAPAEHLYVLPPSHAAFLGRDAAQGDMAAMFQYIAVLGGVESRIVDCFRTGGGIPYEAFDRFHEVMAEESAQTVVAALDEAILPLVPDLVGRLEEGMDVVDIGCGSGRAMNHLASLYPASRFTGYDLCEETVASARKQAAALKLQNVSFERRDAATLGERQFDFVFAFDTVHDQAQPALVLANIRKILKPGGLFLMQDIDAASDVARNLDHPLAPFIYTISTMHCMTVSLARGGAGLGAAWGEQVALTMLGDAGFREVRTHRLEHDPMNIYYVCR